MPNSPVKLLKESYRPKVIRTVGQKPACLVNATVTYCGEAEGIYAFGGFDAYTGTHVQLLMIMEVLIVTDEVYNHVLRLDLANSQWNLGAWIHPAFSPTFLSRATSQGYSHAYGNPKLTPTAVDNYGDIPGVRMGTHFTTAIDTTLLMFYRRPYGEPLPRRQASHLRRRERAQNIPFRLDNL